MCSFFSPCSEYEHPVKRMKSMLIVWRERLPPSCPPYPLQHLKVQHLKLNISKLVMFCAFQFQPSTS